jgi:hypothetical protein
MEMVELEVMHAFSGEELEVMIAFCSRELEVMLAFCHRVVGTLKDGYIRKVPLQQAPRIQHASHVTSNITATDDTCYLVMVPRIFLRGVIWSDHYQGLAGACSYPFPCRD